MIKLVMFAAFITFANGHGRLVSPPGRSTMWRYGYNTLPNYDDNQLSCGGFYTQWTLNKGRCGVCGDPWNGPRENEAGGKYATGTIVAQYMSGQTIKVSVQITATHRGFFEFRLCPVNSPRQTATQDCFDRYLLTQVNGNTKFYEPGAVGTYTVDLKLPSGLTCTQCVLQWKWNTGNSYNCDDYHNCCTGCGPQEQFYGCADIAITPSTGGSIDAHNNNFVQGGVVGFIPITGLQSLCQATAIFRARYAYADRYCVIQCSQNNCPSSIYCTDACRPN